jgi:hypothetical protein
MSDPVHKSAADTPAAALGPTWDLLDSLPRSIAAPSMTSTTLEMVAAAARPWQRRRSWWRGWLGPLAVVASAFVVGTLAGRATVTDPEKAVFEYLPVLEHYDVLQEAGSVEFLTAVARRNYPPPRRFTFSRGGEAAPPVHAALDEAVATFATAAFGPAAGSTAERRTDLAGRPAEERRKLSDAAVEFQRLSPVGRRDLVRLARVFGGHDGAGPDRDELLDAARLWHQWLATRDPADRKGVIDLDTAERLEWLDHYALVRPGSGRGPSRDGGFRGFPPPGASPEGPPPAGPRFNGRPLDGGRPPEGLRRGPPPPGETPAPPR